MLKVQGTYGYFLIAFGIFCGVTGISFIRKPMVLKIALAMGGAMAIRWLPIPYCY
ncbi:hypothetical protein ACFLYL_02560 [Chloroflexota bacterium]